MPGMTRKERDRSGRRKREEREKERKEEKKGDRKGRKKERKKGSKDRKGRGKREWVWKCIMVDRKKDTKGALGIECLYHLWQVSQWSLLLLCFFFSCFCRVGDTVGVWLDHKSREKAWWWLGHHGRRSSGGVVSEMTVGEWLVCWWLCKALVWVFVTKPAQQDVRKHSEEQKRKAFCGVCEL